MVTIGKARISLNQLITERSLMGEDLLLFFMIIIYIYFFFITKEQK